MQSYFPSMPININPSINPNNRKRKMEDDPDSFSNQSMQFDGFNDNPSTKKAKLIPLGAEENLRTLASLGYVPGSNNHPIPFSSESNSNFGSSEGPSSPSLSMVGTPEDSTCPLPSFFGSDDPEGRRRSSFGEACYPKFEIYPQTSFNVNTSQSHSGILGPDMSPISNEDHMDCDGDMMMDRGHGPHCKSIPQLSVRYAGGKESSLWATCVDCGASNQVKSDQPATGLAYSP